MSPKTVDERRKHDVAPHCKPTPIRGNTGFAECCVGVLMSFCRKCGKYVFANSECEAPPEKPWSSRQWFENWESHKARFARPLTDDEKASQEKFANAPVIIGEGVPIGRKR